MTEIRNMCLILPQWTVLLWTTVMFKVDSASGNSELGKDLQGAIFEKAFFNMLSSFPYISFCVQNRMALQRVNFFLDICRPYQNEKLKKLFADFESVFVPQ